MAHASVLLGVAVSLIQFCACQPDSVCQESNSEAGSSLIQYQRNTLTNKLVVGTQSDEPVNASNTHLISLNGTGSGEEKQKGLSRIIGLAVRLPSIGFCRKHPCSPLALPEGGKQQRGIGKTAELNQEGYSKVAHLKDDEEMKDFILRIIDKYDCNVENMDALMGFVPWFSGTIAEQSLTKLEEALLFAVLADGTPWISYKNSAGTTGESARLDLEGYVEVACMRKDEQMKAFARRLAKSMHIKITDEGGFAGTMRYYSGSATFQSFDKLKDEFEAAAKAPHSWADYE
jgi:hypothetical protein